MFQERKTKSRIDTRFTSRVDACSRLNTICDDNCISFSFCELCISAFSILYQFYFRIRCFSMSGNLLIMYKLLRNCLQSNLTHISILTFLLYNNLSCLNIVFVLCFYYSVGLNLMKFK